MASRWLPARVRRRYGCRSLRGRPRGAETYSSETLASARIRIGHYVRSIAGDHVRLVSTEQLAGSPFAVTSSGGLPFALLEFVAVVLVVRERTEEIRHRETVLAAVDDPSFHVECRDPRSLDSRIARPDVLVTYDSGYA